MVNERLVPDPAKAMPAFGTSEGSDELAVTTRLAGGVSASLTWKVIVFGVSSLVDWSGRPEMMGKSFTAMTVMTNELLAASPSSSRTATVMVAVPD